MRRADSLNSLPMKRLPVVLLIGAVVATGFTGCSTDEDVDQACSEFKIFYADFTDEVEDLYSQVQEGNVTDRAGFRTIKEQATELRELRDRTADSQLSVLMNDTARYIDSMALRVSAENDESAENRQQEDFDVEEARDSLDELIARCDVKTDT